MKSTNNIPKFVISKLNVNSLSILTKLKTITKHINDLNNLAYVITDTRSTPALDSQLESLLPNYKLFCNHGSSNSKGTIILLNRKSQCNTVQF